ncbi:methylaspartate mutase E subunit [Streptomyces laurentii]|uniref:Methylaspartate mutase E subunit n=1 Tax=Streptomyces laurentii TaxID=39478 RepID=A0A161JGH7_STRLU|nr:methylaspartate mutase E subunit [Streptomyces laurentii]
MTAPTPTPRTAAAAETSGPPGASSTSSASGPPGGSGVSTTPATFTASTASSASAAPCACHGGVVGSGQYELGVFASAVARARAEGELVVQPRMGMATTTEMALGLEAVKHARARVVGTITLDSYTRVGDHDSARSALAAGADLNGYPLVAHGPDVTRALVGRVAQGGDFAVQIRHGSAKPYDIIATLLDAGLDATEGGPISYCLPYSRTPIAESVDAWARSCDLLASRPGTHLESFGGCMLGQLCPPGLLVALSVLECIFFRRHGLTSVSLSYAQQTSRAQDVEALHALRTLAAEHLDGIDWHVVLYSYMGVFPRTVGGALELLRDSARLAALTGTERMIVKTPAEAHRIPTIADNITALEEAARAAREATATGGPAQQRVGAAVEEEFGVLAEARTLVEAVLGLHPDIGQALILAFERGILDVPYCLHADNAQSARSFIDARGSLQWLRAGAMPVTTTRPAGETGLRAEDLLRMLGHVQDHYDRAALTTTGPTALPTH